MVKVEQQRSPAWFHIRCGRVTASRIPDLLARTGRGWGASRANYLAQLVTERLTGMAEPTYQNAAMLWGIDKEPEARAAYQIKSNTDVRETGFALHPIFFMAGASPDGFVGSRGLVEIKCPNSATHMETLRSQAIPDKHQLQMLWQMACTGRDWCDYVSYDPRFPSQLRLFVRRFERDDARISEIGDRVRDFLAEVDQTIAGLVAVNSPPSAIDTNSLARVESERLVSLGELEIQHAH